MSDSYFLALSFRNIAKALSILYVKKASHMFLLETDQFRNTDQRIHSKKKIKVYMIM